MLKITALGRLTKEAELRFTQSGVGVCTLPMAFDTTYNKAEKKMNTAFINVIVFNRGENKIADRCEQWLQKGSQVLIEGTLQTRNYEAKDGTKRYVTEMIADNVHFLGKSEKKEAQTEPEKELDFSDFGVEVDNMPF